MCFCTSNSFISEINGRRGGRGLEQNLVFALVPSGSCLRGVSSATQTSVRVTEITPPRSHNRESYENIGHRRVEGVKGGS